MSKPKKLPIETVISYARGEVFGVYEVTKPSGKESIERLKGAAENCGLLFEDFLIECFADPELCKQIAEHGWTRDQRIELGLEEADPEQVVELFGQAVSDEIIELKDEVEEEDPFSMASSLTR